MVDEAPLEEVGSGLAPVTAGWFVVNVGKAAWLTKAGTGPCVILMVGARGGDKEIARPEGWNDLPWA